MTENNVLQFDLSPKQIKFKEILSKEFVELEVYAISDANPNRNGSHFTLESMKKAVDGGNLKNKPIVGFFKNNDFMSHEGEANYDVELEKEYWNTERGERILGWIRESDPVELVEKDGLHWIKFRCVLCTAYCYAQVKRLLKDKNKKVSVEITVHKSEQREDGIVNLIDWTLNGTTILGSKNGKEVLEGIPGAHLSILENLDNNALMAQKTALSFAYEKAFGVDEDKSDIVEEQSLEQNSERKEETNVENENVIISNENVEVSEEFEPKEEKVKESAENCDDCENCDCDEKIEEKEEVAVEEIVEEKEDCPCPEDNGELEMEKCEEQVVEDCEQPCEEKLSEDGCDVCGEPHDDDVHDEPDDDPDDHDELCKMQKRCEELEAKCEEYCEMISVMKAEFEAEIAKYADYAEIKDRMEKAEAKLYAQSCAELKQYAESIMENEKIEKCDYEAICEKCLTGGYSKKEEIFADVAVAAFKNRTISGERFSSSIEVPAMGIEKAEEKLMTREERMKARVAKCGK